MSQVSESKAAASSTYVQLSDIVDRYAELHSQINDMQAEAEVLKAQLIASGTPSIRGTFVKATVTTSKPRVTVDWKGLAADLNLPQDLIDAFTKVGDPVTSLRLYAN